MKPVRRLWYTVAPPLMPPSPQQPSLYTTAAFLGRQPIHSLFFKPLYNGHLSTMATLFCPQGGRCGEVHLYVFVDLTIVQFRI